jgi:FtsP/CotA-like multicopper oxidase with cupredoxin domain
VIRPINGVVNTSLTVDLRTNSCIPIWNGNSWVWQSMSLRTFGSPQNGNNPNDPNLLWTIPAPTFRVRKAYLAKDTQPPGPSNPQTSPGTRLRVLLKNQLPNNSYPYHQCDPETVEQNGKVYKQTFPECFHGPDVTNLHYHGTHVSSQPHQDFVLLELFSSKQTNPPPPASDETHAIGSYQTDLNPFPWNQPPGTHWYHPHKHGSTGLQVLNGMAGALLIQGPFDDWLYQTYKVDPANDAQLEKFEKVMVVQQIFDKINFFNAAPPTGYPPQLLIDGQADPIVRMQPGEVQRWRFISGTMQAAAQVVIAFPSGFTVKQIAQDGVQFAPENWVSQPLLTGGEIILAPGNRTDFLVQAPPAGSLKAGPGPQRFPVTFRLRARLADAAQKIFNERRLQRLEAAGRGAGKGTGRGAGNLSLFTIEVGGTASPMTLPCPFGTAGKCATFPPTPWYLRDITDGEVGNRQRTIAFSMTDPKTGIAGQQGTLPNGFWVNKTAYNASCANDTMVVGTAETWTISNDSLPNHPYHIHVNPFQLRRYDAKTYKAPYVWMDTVALPAVACGDASAGPLFNQQEAAAKCPGVCAAFTPSPPLPSAPPAYTWNGQWRTTGPGTSVCGCCQGAAVKSVEYRTRLEDYTGGYVFHCHFLGHEDRGMMHNVQTVCPGTTPDKWKYGKLSSDGSADDCKATSPVPALPACPPPGPAYDASQAHSHH